MLRSLCVCWAYASGTGAQAEQATALKKEVELRPVLYPHSIFFGRRKGIGYTLRKDIVYVDLWRGTTLSLAWLEADGNLSEDGLARLIGSGFKKGSIIYYSCFEFESTLAVELNGVGVDGLCCPDPGSWEFSFSRDAVGDGK